LAHASCLLIRYSNYTEDSTEGGRDRFGFVYVTLDLSGDAVDIVKCDRSGKLNQVLLWEA
jgi:hypothetical protein